jgi:hypothetical protein
VVSHYRHIATCAHERHLGLGRSEVRPPGRLGSRRCGGVVLAGVLEDRRVDEAFDVLAGAQSGRFDHRLHASARGHDAGGFLVVTAVEVGAREGDAGVARVEPAGEVAAAVQQRLPTSAGLENACIALLMGGAGVVSQAARPAVSVTRNAVVVRVEVMWIGTDDPHLTDPHCPKVGAVEIRRRRRDARARIVRIARHLMRRFHDARLWRGSVL